MIAFSCSDCGMKFSVKEEFAGRSTRCPSCKHALVVPAAVGSLIPGEFKGTASSLFRAGVPSAMTLVPPEEVEPGQKSLPELLAGRDVGERYIVESEIARGGMGAVLRAVDCDIRREVAVKYILDQSDSKKKLRFVEEAQITGQLEHPNIVPIHELGVDAKDRLFFTMKLIKGRSLAEVVRSLQEAPRYAERQYPLGRLLSIFVGVCHALAYAHSRGVVHRDLKPANIMIGDFGEVYVMDWGLAKVIKGTSSSADRDDPPAAVPLPTLALMQYYDAPATRIADPVEAIPSAASATKFDSRPWQRGDDVPTARAVAPDGTAYTSGMGTVVTSRDPDTDLTREGAVLGTPAYMPPEQAAGLIHLIDRRSDIYSLGAVLYELLALEPPVSREGTYADIIERVIAGAIVPPERANRPRASRGGIPAELSAVAMKALATRPEDRYQTVEELRNDIERFVEGRSVSAKEDTKREVLVKFVKRNKGFSAVAASAVVLISVVVGWSTWFNIQARRAAETAYADYRTEQKEKEERTRQAVPALIEVARQDIHERRFDKALTQLNVALEYDPDNADARLLKALVLLSKLQFEEGLVLLDRHLAVGPGDANAVELRKLCARPKPDDVGNLVRIAGVFVRQGLPGLAEGLLSKHGRDADSVRRQLLFVYRKRLDEAWKGGGHSLSINPDGGFSLALSVGGRDLSPLRDIPLTELLLDCRDIDDLSALQGMPIKKLDLTNCVNLKSLSGLKGLPVETLRLFQCDGVADLSPLREMPLKSVVIVKCASIAHLTGLVGMPLTTLELEGCGNLRSLEGLKDMPLIRLRIDGCPGIRALTDLGLRKLEVLSLAGNGIRDLSSLKAMPLNSLILSDCTILNDLSPLTDSRLTSLDLSGCTEVRDLSPLRGLPLNSLKLARCGLLSDISGLKGLKLIHLDLSGCGRIKDLSVLEGMPLMTISLSGCGMKDLAVLKGMPFTALDLEGCPALADLSGLNKMPLNRVNLSRCPVVRDLSALRGMPLTVVDLVGCTGITDLAPLKDSPILRIALAGCSGIRTLAPLQGMKIDNLRLEGCTALDDLEGLRGLPLQILTLGGSPKLKDLSPLRGSPLNSISISSCESLTDLSGLKDVPLKAFSLHGCTGFTDLSPLSTLPLNSVHITNAGNLMDLSPLKGLRLTELDITGTAVRDLTPLRQMGLTWLRMDKCIDLHDLTPLEGIPLAEVYLPPQVTKGMDVLRKMKTLARIDGRPPEEFWKEFDSRPRPK